MDRSERLICEAHELAAGGRGVRFDIDYRGQTVPAFAVRTPRGVAGYLNRCAHVPMELDWQAGVFFDADGRDLICSTHGAVYDADHGACLGGPCDGAPLVKLDLVERDGRIYLRGSMHE